MVDGLARNGSQGGHFERNGRVGAVELDSLRRDLEQGYLKFGLTLKRAIWPNSKRGFSKSYVIALCQGKRPATDEISTAFSRIAAAHDGVDPTTATSKEATVCATEDIGGALVTGRVVECARPGCMVKFVRCHPSQKYHSAWCRNRK